LSCAFELFSAAARQVRARRNGTAGGWFSSGRTEKTKVAHAIAICYASTNEENVLLDGKISRAGDARSGIRSGSASPYSGQDGGALHAAE
jgi:hypothetical protein